MWKILAVLVALGGCGARPQAPAEPRTLQDEANLVLDEMRTRDPSLDPLLAVFAGYAVFPEVGAHGRGVLYEQGRPVGYVELQQSSLGPPIFSELVILQDDRDIELLIKGTIHLGADASAIVLTNGAAAAARFDRGMSVFVLPRGGEAGIAVSGQRIRFEPLG